MLLFLAQKKKKKNSQISRAALIENKDSNFLLNQKNRNNRKINNSNFVLKIKKKFIYYGLH